MYVRICVCDHRCCFYFFFFFKQKTAYEMRISDWSSDVCSSDLVARLDGVVPIADQEEGKEARQFPEKHELDQVAREHDAQHGTHESQQEREEDRKSVV